MIFTESYSLTFCWHAFRDFDISDLICFSRTISLKLKKQNIMRWNSLSKELCERNKIALRYAQMRLNEIQRDSV